MNKHLIAITTLTLGVMLLLTPALASAKNKIDKQGFAFEYPTGWTYEDLGKDDFEGMAGYTMAMGSTEGVSVVVMVFPDFSLDLEGAGFSFGDFSKLVLESFLGENKTPDLKIESSRCSMSHGDVDAFIATDTSQKGVKFSKICADKKGKKAAIVIIATDSPSNDKKTQNKIIEAENIVKSLSFPAGQKDFPKVDFGKGKKIEKQGFTFQYPEGWTYSDLGKDNFEGMDGYTMAMGNEEGVSVVVMVFPDFSLDIETAQITFGDFSKMVLESFLGENKTPDLKIEDNDCNMSHGKVFSYIAEDTSNSNKFKASVICGDKKKKKAAIVIIAADVNKGDKKSEQRVKEAIGIVNSLAFPINKGKF